MLIQPNNRQNNNHQSNNPQCDHLNTASTFPLTVKYCTLAAYLTSLFVGFSLSASVLALPSDREQPIYIQADHAERNENLGTTIYTGSVQMDQGSLRILADQVTVHNADDGVEKIIATGIPAHLQQKPSVDKTLVVARGNTITYTITNEKIVLQDNALLEQDGSTTRAARIDYNVAKASAKAVGNENKRVEMTLQPQKKTEDHSQ